jgi:signal transduction histidine kinase
MVAKRISLRVWFAWGLLLGWLLLAPVSPAAPAALSPPPPLVLTNASLVRALSPAMAARHLPVALRGVVLMEASPHDISLVIQDQTEAIYLIGTAGMVSPVHTGDLVDVKGTTDPGDFAPVVRIRSLKKIGSRSLPAPQPVTYEELIRKQFDAQYVELHGIVRSCAAPEDPANPRAKMVIATGGERLVVRVHSLLAKDSFVDAEVRLRGICFSRHTASRQLLNPMLDIPRGFAIQIEKPAPADPWKMPVMPVSDLLRFAPNQDYGHRVHVRGVVTHYSPGDSLWIREGNHGLRIQSSQMTSLRAGDMVDVLGFPSQGDYSPILEDGEFTQCGVTNPPAPILVTNLLMAALQDADLIQLEGRLNEIRPVQDGLALTLEWNNSPIEARLKLPAGQEASVNWQPGSQVRVAGMAMVVSEPGGPLTGIFQPHTFGLLLRSTSDMVLLRPPPWWTAEHILLLLVILVSVSLLATALAMLAGRLRLREQARRRALAEAEFAAILAERNRLAREIHDTLAQGLAATAVQLRLAKKSSLTGSEQLAQRLDLAQALVSESLDQARKSIWNMRSQVLETGDLATALGGILTQLCGDTGTETRIEVTGPPRRLAPAVENNLLRIGQEAITNAARHARAKLIELRLQFAETSFCLTVRDDGCGFDPAAPPPSAGGFGLVGMRERAAELNAELEVCSALHDGTEINLRVPLTGKQTGNLWL